MCFNITVPKTSAAAPMSMYVSSSLYTVFTRKDDFSPNSTLAFCLKYLKKTYFIKKTTLEKVNKNNESHLLYLQYMNPYSKQIYHD